MPETEEAVITEQQSIAALMATKGYNSNDRPEEIQVDNKPDNEQKVETKVEAPAAIASAETKVETVVQETKPPTQETEIKNVEENLQTVIPTWQEVLKQQQPDTVLKELGFDDNKVGLVNRLKDLPPQVIGLLDTWQANGDLVAYLKEMTTDYYKMSSVDVMRSQLRLEYPKASDKAFEALYKKEIVEAYQLDPDKYSEDEVENGNLLLDAKADKFRDSLVQRQQQFLIPKAPEAVTIEPDDSSEREEAARFEERKAYVNNDTFVKNMFATKQFTIGEGLEAFHYPIDPVKVNGVLFDGDKWREAINEVYLNDKGEKVIGKPKPELQSLVSMVAIYGKDFLNAYAEHFKTIGGKKVIEPIENAKPPAGNMEVAQIIAPTSPAGAMARGGRMTN